MTTQTIRIKICHPAIFPYFADFSYLCSMKYSLKENQGIPAGLLWTLSTIAALSVANLYYNQPLLNQISNDLAISEFTANLIPMTTQIGYALGLLFIIPLGDLYKRRTIITTNFILLAFSMCAIAMAPGIHFVLAASVITGVCSVIPQIFIPIASQFSRPEHKARNVGILVSGLLTGILGSRVISGIVGEYWGWRTMYYIASILMVISLIIVRRALPDMPSNFKGTYGGLMKSLLKLYIDQPAIRIVSIRAGLCFGSFLALWACLAFKLSGAPFHAGNNIIGMLGLCGIAGAITASFVGSYVKKWGVRNLNYIGNAFMILAWIIMLTHQNTYLGFIIGIVLIDIGMQCVQISNQTCALSMAPHATNRANTIFMTTYFIGGSLGTFLAGSSWHLMNWNGVVYTGIGLVVCSLCITLFTRH